MSKFTRLNPSALILLSAALASGCATAPKPEAKPAAAVEAPAPVLELNPGFAKIALASTPEAKDRAAILAMQGEYKVQFNFAETVSLTPGYLPKAAKKSGASELVIVVEDSPSKVVLQHLLVMDDGMVIKHWRQDWEYQAKRRFEFVADQTWRMREIKADLIRGAWTQCVFEVSDAPRYCGTGRFEHSFGVATWTSDRTWRPLPRREYTTRSDYNVVDSINRHSITPNGWTHEQDNTKTVREGEKVTKTLVREFGFNDYRSTSEHNFEPGRDYWNATAKYWEHVRVQWANRFAQNGQVQLLTTVTDTKLMTALEEQARTWLPENQGLKTDETEVAPSSDADAKAVQAALAQWTR